MDPVHREFLLAFWKIHILQHASERAVYGQGIAEELKSHGYAISPGILAALRSRVEEVHREVCSARAAGPRRRSQVGTGRPPSERPERERLR